MHFIPATLFVLLNPEVMVHRKMRENLSAELNLRQDQVLPEFIIKGTWEQSQM